MTSMLLDVKQVRIQDFPFGGGGLRRQHPAKMYVKTKGEGPIFNGGSGLDTLL